MRNNNLGLRTEGMMSSLESPDTKKCFLKITHGLSYLYFSHLYQLWTQPLPSDHIFSHGGGSGWCENVHLARVDEGMVDE